MQTVTFDISKDAFGFVQAQGFSKPSDYFTMRLADDMLVAHEEEQKLEALHMLLDEGEASGYVPVDDNFWKKMSADFAAIREKHLVYKN